MYRKNKKRRSGRSYEVEQCEHLRVGEAVLLAICMRKWASDQECRGRDVQPPQTLSLTWVVYAVLQVPVRALVVKADVGVGPIVERVPAADLPRPWLADCSSEMVSVNKYM